jgi:hypothetical protein
LTHEPATKFRNRTGVALFALTFAGVSRDILSAKHLEKNDTNPFVNDEQIRDAVDSCRGWVLGVRGILNLSITAVCPTTGCVTTRARTVFKSI